VTYGIKTMMQQYEPCAKLVQWK